MVVCQHFLKGNCKFGDRCWNEHPGGGQNRGRGGFVDGGGNFAWRGGFGGEGRGFSSGNFGGYRNSGGRTFNNNFQPNQNRFNALSQASENSFQRYNNNTGKGFSNQNKVGSSVTGGFNTNTILESIKKDLVTWEHSGIWPFSCYSFHGSEPCLTGFMEFSPEELRYEAYKAMKSDGITQYKQGLEKLQRAVIQRRNEFKNMTIQQLEQEISKARSPPLPSGGLFGQTTGPEQTQVFGASPVSTGVFGPKTMDQGQPGFLTQPVQPFGSTTLSMNQPAVHTGNIFAGNSQSSISTNSMQNSAFPSTGTSNLKPAIPTTMTPTVTPNSSEPRALSAGSLLPPPKCSEKDLEAFRASQFVLGQIPECPPPPELCN